MIDKTIPLPSPSGIYGKKLSGGLWRSHRVLIVSIVVFVLYAWVVRCGEIHQFWAVHGFSPIHYTNLLLYPENFARDYPGAQVYKFSLPMQIYPFAARYLGIPPEVMIKYYILFDMALMAFAVLFFATAVRPGISPIALGGCVAWMLSSLARSFDPSALGHALFYGWYYHAAESCALIAFSLALRRHYFYSWLFLVASFTSHAAFGPAVGTFLLAVSLARGRTAITGGNISGFVLAMVLVMLWAFGVLDVTGATTTGPKVPKEIWFALSKLFQYDIYPIGRKQFTSLHYYGFTPLMAFWILGVHYFRRFRKDNEEKARVILWGLLPVFAISLFGLSVSEQTFSTFLVRLGLHRSMIVITTFLLIYIMDGLCRDVIDRPWWLSLPASLVIISPFLRYELVFPVLFLVALSIPSAIELVRAKQRSPLDWLFIILLLGFFIVIAVYQAVGYMNVTLWIRFFYKRFLIVPIAGFFFLFWAARYAARRGYWNSGKSFATLWLAVIIFSGACLYVQMIALNSPFNRETWQYNNNYLQAQLWARENTPKDSLFMADPTFGQGWRNYSRRSSLGKMREWVMASWLYSMDYRIYSQGMERLRALGIKIEDYLKPGAWWKDGDRCIEETGRKFYAMSDEDRMVYARHFGIDYFVLQKNMMLRSTALKIAYENKDFIVLAAHGRDKADPR